MSEPLTPALTPEEWASFPNWPRAEQRGELPLYYPTRHGIAAVNLHNTPQGFTQADVELLNRCARGCDGTLDAEDDERVFPDGIEMRMKDVRRLLSLADRIAALLPPAPPTTEPR